MKWHWIYNYTWSSHAIPDNIYTAVMESLHERGLIDYKSEDLTSMIFDLPGMIHADREFRTVVLGDLTISIPCTDWEFLYEELLNTKVRTDAAVPYYKLHGFYRCLCLTPELRDEMLKQMLAQMQEANAQRELENRRFNDAIENSSGGVLAEGPEDVGNALKKARKSGKKPLVVVARRPTKDDIADS